MTRSIGRSVISYLLATVVTGATGVVLLPIYARALGPAAYGELELGIALAALLTSLGVAGLDTAVGIAWFRDPERSRPAFVSAALGLCAVASVIATIAGLAIGLPIVAQL